MSAKEVTAFEQIPNVGKEIAKDFILLGVKTPEQLKSQDEFDLYVRLCQITKSYHDPCVLDTFLAAIEFMNEISNKKWWDFTAQRQKDFGRIAHLVEKWKA